MWARRGRIFIWDIRFGHYVSKFDDDMDYKRALFEGPWLVGDHYVISEEWKPNFEPGYSQVNTIWAWVRLSGIPLEYFDDGILRSIGDKIGKTVKVANTTLFGLRGNYARVCVEIDLHKPFVSKYRLNRRVHRVEYEGLHEICFTCGRYGHGQGGCPSKVSNDPVDQENTFFNPIFSDGDSRPELEEEYGPWMKAKKKVRRSRQPNLPEAKAGKDKEPENVGSRFNVLTEEEEETIIVVDLEPMQESDMNVGPAPKGTLGSKQASAMEKPNRRLEFSPNQQRVSSDSKLTTQTGSVRTGNKKEETSKVDKTGEMQMGTGRGRVTLAIPVLNTLPTYLMQTTLLPVEICNAIDKKIWDFIWGSFNGERKMHMINWETICIPNNQGGLGLRSARELNQAYLMKLVWGLIKNPTELWADLLISKYMKRTPTGLSLRQAVRKSSYWRGISDNWEMFRGGLRWSIHNGKKTNFWR
ncbi:Putative ribonuclease H protein At1g65750 [Linum perenne]